MVWERGGGGLFGDADAAAAAGHPCAFGGAEDGLEVGEGLEAVVDGVGVGGEGVVFLDLAPDLVGAGAVGGGFEDIGDAVFDDACGGEVTADVEGFHEVEACADGAFGIDDDFGDATAGDGVFVDADGADFAEADGEVAAGDGAVPEAGAVLGVGDGLVVVALILALIWIWVGVLRGDEADEGGGEGGDGETFHGMVEVLENSGAERRCHQGNVGRIPRLRRGMVVRRVLAGSLMEERC